jgi:hypothetical protein
MSTGRDTGGEWQRAGGGVDMGESNVEKETSSSCLSSCL